MDVLEGDLSERAICLRGRFVLEGESSVYRIKVQPFSLVDKDLNMRCTLWLRHKVKLMNATSSLPVFTTCFPNMIALPPYSRGLAVHKGSLWEDFYGIFFRHHLSHMMRFAL